MPSIEQVTTATSEDFSSCPSGKSVEAGGEATTDAYASNELVLQAYSTALDNLDVLFHEPGSDFQGAMDLVIERRAALRGILALGGMEYEQAKRATLRLADEYDVYLKIVGVMGEQCAAYAPPM